MELPFKYLGMIVGGNLRRERFWIPIIEKIKLCLSSWKGKLLSMVVRMCLVKSMINALPLFYLSLYKAPVPVCQQIRKIQASFLRGWGYEGKKIAWIGWDKICRPEGEGGLGIRDIGKFNYALIAKWKWRLGVEEGGLWKEVLESRYGSWRNLNVDLTNRKCFIWWRDLGRVCNYGPFNNWFDGNFIWWGWQNNKVLGG